MNKTCTWEYDEFSECYNTECGENHVFYTGGAWENGYNFCPFCGRKLTIKQEEVEVEEEE